MVSNKMTQSVRGLIRRFRDDTAGTVSVEAAMIFPVVMTIFLSLFVYFEGYRQAGVNHKASNTIADMLSRETTAITDTYVDNVKDLFDLLAEANGNTKIRLSAVKWDETDNEYQVDWSAVRGAAMPPLETPDLVQMTGSLPVLPDQERIMLIETWSTYKPLFRIGMNDTVLRTFVFTRLRFAPQLTYFSVDNDDGSSHNDF